MQQYLAVIDGGNGGEETFAAESLADALKLAAEWAREGDYEAGDGTIWVSVCVTECPESVDSLAQRITDAGWSIANADDDRLYLALTIADDEEAGDRNESMDELRAFVGDGWTVEWTGSSNTDAAGDTSGDVLIAPCSELESDTRTVAIDPPEPDCVHGREHEWESPHHIVGGLEENPGVWGHGGGVLITRCCMRCGCARETDTWAQNPENGEQGLTSVRYEPGRFADEVPSAAERDLRDAISCRELRACAAYVLSVLRDESSDLRDDVPEASRARAREVAEFAERVQRKIGTERALALALYLAARTANEVRAAEAIVEHLTERPGTR